ncbi:hypothetical protein H2Y57_14995 [Pectobacterium aroidearum]|jgi:hypothetical protein|uniref:Uncharacterized protein n=1 Tax=Pectobacterium aroidearum TaxID=1201031 RepID=A0AAW3SWT3_9GAMM|nr:hypothetical protein [Pectobacterium aroidearum]MBA5204985.1 hypothetical protein [Pectobacterium aroidearum]
MKMTVSLRTKLSLSQHKKALLRSQLLPKESWISHVGFCLSHITLHFVAHYFVKNDAHHIYFFLHFLLAFSASLAASGFASICLRSTKNHISCVVEI